MPGSLTIYLTGFIVLLFTFSVSIFHLDLSSVSTLVCKEELNCVLTVLRMLVKVGWVELGGTDFLLPILRLAPWFDKYPKTI